MYQPLPTDVSGRNYQDEMRDMLHTMIPAFEAQYDFPHIGPSLIKEFNDMLEFSGATVVGVDDRARAVVDYLEHHYAGDPPPQWYANLL